MKQLETLRQNFRSSLAQKPKKTFVPFADNSQDGIFDINILRIYTDVDGVMLAKTDAAIPAALKVNLPVYLLGSFDRKGGNAIAQQVLPLPAGVFMLGTFVWNTVVPAFVQLSGLNDIQTKIFPGDIVTVYTDNIAAPSAFVWMIQQTSSASINSIVEDSYSMKPLRVKSINFVTDSLAQFSLSLHMTRATKLGRYIDNEINLSVFRSPDYRINDIVTLDLQFENSPYNSLNIVMAYAANVLQFVFDCSIDQ